MWEGCSVSFEEETSALDWPSQRSRHLRIRPQFSSILPVTQKPGHFPAIVKIISTVQWSTVHHSFHHPPNTIHKGSRGARRDPSIQSFICFRQFLAEASRELGIKTVASWVVRVLYNSFSGENKKKCELSKSTLSPISTVSIVQKVEESYSCGKSTQREIKRPDQDKSLAHT